MPPQKAPFYLFFSPNLCSGLPIKRFPEMLMKLKELSFLFKTAVESGAEKALVSAGALQEHLTKAEAYRLYGRLNVDRWLREGLLKPISPNSPISKLMLDRKTLESVAESSNRITYLPVAER